MEGIKRWYHDHRTAAWIRWLWAHRTPFIILLLVFQAAFSLYRTNAALDYLTTSQGDLARMQTQINALQHQINFGPYKK